MNEKEKRIQQQIVKMVVDGEWMGSSDVAQFREQEYEGFVGLLDSVRDDKEYDWMSNIRIPEFASQMLTQSSIDVDQYFKSRDFVECYLQDESEEAIKSAAAVKELVNRTLNRRSLQHYLKFVRAKNINHLIGSVYAICWWEQELKEQKLESVEGESSVRVILKDEFQYDILDPRMVRTSPEYAYSIQDKEWVIVEQLKSKAWLKQNEERLGLINLDLLDNMEADKIKEINDKKAKGVLGVESYNPVVKDYKILTRFGKFWCVVKERDEETGLPVKIDYGVDEEGKVKKDAELVEMQLKFAVVGNTGVLIRYNVSPFVDSSNKLYRNIIRGLCYVHPTLDDGVGDGKYGRELQTAIDDTFNMSNDRTLLATMPTFKGRKYSLLDNDTVYFEPEHVIQLENMDDLQEIPISDNINGALAQLGFLVGKTNQVMSIFPTTMGALPTQASTTATAVAGASSRTDMRTGYKSTTFENTFLLDLYWMIIQMSSQFMQQETAFELLGNKIVDFDPTKEYWFKPVSQSLESEESKQAKIKNWITVLGYISQIPHPDVVKQINYVLNKIYSYMGDEQVNFGNKMLNEQQPIQGGAGLVREQGVPTQNQTGLPQGNMEQMVRGV